MERTLFVNIYIYFLTVHIEYEGAKEMLLVDNVDNKEYLRDLLDAMFDELPAPKKK